MDTDLLNSIYAYLTEVGLDKTAAALDSQAQISKDDRFRGLLATKFHVIGKLQKQIVELKSQLKEASCETGFVTTEQELKLPKEPSMVLRGAKKCVNSVAFHDRSSVLAVAGDDCTIRVYNCADNGSLMFTLVEHVQPVTQVLFHNDTLISCSLDASIKIWDVGREAVVRTLSGHLDSVTCMALLKSDFLVSASKDDSIRIWDLNNGELKKSIEAERVRAVAISFDGEFMATADHTHVTLI